MHEIIVAAMCVNFYVANEHGNFWLFGLAIDVNSAMVDFNPLFYLRSKHLTNILPYEQKFN
jgi:hypothetical protein